MDRRHGPSSTRPNAARVPVWCLCLALLFAACSEVDPSRPAAWLELERCSAVDSWVWVDPDGSFTGSRASTSFAGKFTQSQVADLHALFTTTMIASYRTDAQFTDPNANFDCSDALPVFSIVVRNDTAPISVGSERLDAHFTRTAAKPTTAKMLAFVDDLIDKVQQ